MRFNKLKGSLPFGDFDGKDPKLLGTSFGLKFNMLQFLFFFSFSWKLKGDVYQFYSKSERMTF